MVERWWSHERESAITFSTPARYPLTVTARLCRLERRRKPARCCEVDRFFRALEACAPAVKPIIRSRVVELGEYAVVGFYVANGGFSDNGGDGG